MPFAKIAFALIVAAALNGSVAEAMSPPCAARPVCVLSLDPLDTQLHRASLALDLDEDGARARIAPPARPAGLGLAPRPLAAQEAAEVDDGARHAPPARPAHLLRTAANR